MNSITSVNNPYGLAGMWNTGDIVTRAVIILLLILSLVSWYTILIKLWDQRRLKQSARTAEKQFWSAPSVKDGVAHLQTGASFRSIAAAVLRHRIILNFDAHADGQTPETLLTEIIASVLEPVR